MRATLNWVKTNPACGLLICTLFATFVYFFGVVPLFIRGTFVSGACSVFAWAWQAWNPGANQEHSKIVPFVFVGLIWYHRKEISRAPKAGSNTGLIFVGIGILLFLLSVRCLQPRMALGAIPF